MPDQYELKYKLNPKDASDASKYRQDGYTNIEEYLNSLVNINDVRPSIKK
jgi:hypothetical protein